MIVFEEVKVLLRGVSLVMLQSNALTGFLFLIGIFYNSWLMGIGAVLGVVIGTLTASVLKYDRKEIVEGNYGFNAALVGIALLFFYEANLVTFILIILGSILSSLSMNFMMKKNVSPYTFPFVLTTWILIAVVKLFSLLPSLSNEIPQVVPLHLVSSLSMGFGQVMFQASVVTGFFFLAGLLVSSRIAATYACIGSVVGMLVGLFFSLPLHLINAGIFGYNAVLCGIAFSDKKAAAIPYALLAILFSILITYGMITFNIIALTAPFVFASWIVLLLKK